MPYRPRIAPWPENLADKLPVIEVFYSLQGEGRHAGIPAVFIRLKYCNLGCAWCDTRFTWDEVNLEEGDLFSLPEIAVKARDAVPESVAPLDRVHVVLTGGEPMLHQEQLPQLIGKLREHGFTFIEMETNGMFAPSKELAELVDWWNCSPKLSNNLLDSETQLVPHALEAIAATGKADFKFVIQAPHEIEEVIAAYLPLLPPERIMIMPEGQTCARQLSAMSEIADICLEYGFRLCPRLHTLIWDNERGK